MTKRTRYTILIGLGLVGVFLAPIITLAAGFGGLDIPFWAPNGLVVCQENATLDSPGYCTNLCQITELADNVIKFGFTILLFVIAPIMIVVGGGMILIAGASETLLSKGKTILKGAVVGVVLALLAYVIVGTFLWLIGNKAAGPNVARVSWPTVQCSPGAAPGILPPPPPQGITPGGGAPTVGKGCPPDKNGSVDASGWSDCIKFGGAEIKFKPGVGEKAARKMVEDAIYCFDDNYSGQITVTEAYPTTYKGHASPQHYNGCAIDFKVEYYNGWLFSNSIKPKALSCGLYVLDEYAHPSPGATGAGHIHISLPSSTCP